MAKSYKYGKVLVIDDNPIDRMLARKALEAYGFAETIIVMEGAQQALDYLSDLQYSPADLPELIFVDLSMPVIGGLDFLREYEKLPASVQKKNIIILTSSLNTSDKVQSMQSPYVIKFLNKPLKAELLEQL
jgi:CheY-like chemotaxis protein